MTHTVRDWKEIGTFMVIARDVPHAMVRPEATDDSDELLTKEDIQDGVPERVRVEFDPKRGFDQDRDKCAITFVHKGCDIEVTLHARTVGRGGDINDMRNITIEDYSGQRYTVRLDTGIVTRREESPQDDTFVGENAEVFVEEVESDE